MITVEHFALLAALAGNTQEQLTYSGQSLRQIYAELKLRHSFGFGDDQLRPVCNDALVDWDWVPKSGDRIAFLPPFSGG